MCILHVQPFAPCRAVPAKVLPLGDLLCPYRCLGLWPLNQMTSSAFVVPVFIVLQFPLPSFYSRCLPQSPYTTLQRYFRLPLLESIISFGKVEREMI